MPHFTKGELEVMRILWEHGELKPAEIQRRFPWELKNPSLRSYLTILLDKGHVVRRRIGKAYFYKAKTRRDSAFRSMVRDVARVCCDGSVEVLHYLAFLRDHVGWAELKKRVKVPLTGLRVAPFYGCTLLRPISVSVNGPSASLFEDFLAALGAAPTAFAAAQECCGSYQSLAHPQQAAQRAGDVLRAAQRSSADAIALSCPLCEYNLGTRQPEALAQHADLKPIPTFYFTQLLGVALGLAPEHCHFELNGNEALQLLRDREYVAAVTA